MNCATQRELYSGLKIKILDIISATWNTESNKMRLINNNEVHIAAGTISSK